MSRQKIDKIEQEVSPDLVQDEEGLSHEDEALKCTLPSQTGKKRSWTADEDAYLIKLVQKYGAQKWTSIAEHLPGKSHFIQGELASSVERDGIII